MTETARARTLARDLTRDTTLCISLASRPSRIGTRFHNYLYDLLGLDFAYKSFATTDLAGAVAGIRALNIRGCGVSMPFKEDIIAMVDELDPSAQAIGSVNTVVNDNGYLRGYNSDYVAIASLLRAHHLPAQLSAAVAGSGGMAKAVVAALRDHGLTDVVVVARNEATGRALADRYGYAWIVELGGHCPNLLVNATPVGMAGGGSPDDLPFDAANVKAARTVFDVVASPWRSPLIALAQDRGIPAITGKEVFEVQAAEQFGLYTGARPSPDQIHEASEFSRSGL